MRGSLNTSWQLGFVAVSLLCACSPSQQELLAQQRLVEKQLAQKQYEIQLQAYQNDLERYNRWRVQQRQRCFELDSKQVELNRAYFQIKHDSPVTAGVVLDALNKYRHPNLTDEQKRAITNDVRSQCLIVALGDGDCSKVYNDINYAVEQQRLLNEQVQNECCEVKTNEEPYSDIGRTFQPRCTIPSPPQPPTPASE